MRIFVGEFYVKLAQLLFSPYLLPYLPILLRIAKIDYRTAKKLLALYMWTTKMPKYLRNNYRLLIDIDFDTDARSLRRLSQTILADVVPRHLTAPQAAIFHGAIGRADLQQLLATYHQDRMPPPTIAEALNALTGHLNSSQTRLGFPLH